MSGRSYIPPTMDLEAFNCPHCHVYAKQHWDYMYLSEDPEGHRCTHVRDEFRVSSCMHCGGATIWRKVGIIFPDYLTAEPPNSDLPPEVVADYEEARGIVEKSPRGAAALLRLAIQKLCKHLGKTGKNINDDIKALVADGLPPRVQQALDTVRVIGNNAVHPGEINFDDNRDVAFSLFKLVNFITEKMISEPKEIDALYNALPDGAREGIDRRDNST